MTVEARRLADRLVAELVAAGAIATPAVEEAMRAVPRHLFVPNIPIADAYANEAIPTKLFEGRAVSSASQPQIVAGMLEQLDLRAGQRVLEIGAGTGYNAALLGRLVGQGGHVVSVDIDDDIVESAREHLADAGVRNVEVVLADGGFGHQPGAPYDRIVITVGAPDIVPAWWDQLAPGGRLLLPLSLRVVQRCVAFDKGNDSMESASVRGCGFMRLRGGFEGQEKVVTVGAVTLTFEAEIDASVIESVLDRPAGQQVLDLDVGAEECFDGLPLWLALHDPNYCNVDVRESGGESSPMAVAVSFGTGERKIGWSPASLDTDSLAVVGVEDRRLVISMFGTGTGRPRHLVDAVKEWDASGRPDSSTLSIRAYRSPREVPTNDGAFKVEKQWTTLLVEWPPLPPAPERTPYKPLLASDRPVTHLLCGLPASGKTTYARALSENRGAVRFTLDEWMLRLYGLSYDDPEYAERSETCQHLIWDIALQLLRLGRDVILDWNQWSRERRARWRDRAGAEGFPVELHFLDVPLQTAIRRAQDRSDAWSHDIDAGGVEHLASLLEVPSEDEGIPIWRIIE
jgi:protein-L-isoaspartate(D-aspartate) O-methyltransferase